MLGNAVRETPGPTRTGGCLREVLSQIRKNFHQPVPAGPDGPALSGEPLKKVAASYAVPHPGAIDGLPGQQQILHIGCQNPGAPGRESARFAGRAAHRLFSAWSKNRVRTARTARARAQGRLVRRAACSRPAIRTSRPTPSEPA